MTEEIFNISRACEDLKIDKAIYIRIASRALEQTLKDLQQMHQANQARDAETVQAISHRLKGDFANLRMNHLSDAARQLNILVKEKYNFDEAAVLIEKFENVFEQTKNFFQENTR